MGKSPRRPQSTKTDSRNTNSEPVRPITYKETELVIKNLTINTPRWLYWYSLVVVGIELKVL
jgi:hypothetical protein